jgi:hypothetical protein
MHELRVLGEKYPVSLAVEKFQARSNAYEGWEENLRYFLFRYEEDLATRDGAAISDEVWKQIWSSSAARSIEHIAPQEFSVAWGDSTAAYHSAYGTVVNQLGNLIVLPPGINSEAGRKSFKEKKAIYLKNHLRMMNDWSAGDLWEPKHIQIRIKMLLDWALKAFDDIPD